MTVTVRPTATGSRPAAVWAATGLLVFLGVTAAGGGVALVLRIASPPDAWLAGIPLIDTWVVPGLVLGIGFGGGSLLAAYGMLRRPSWAWLRPVERLTRHHWSWSATLLIGVGQVAWIALELVYLPQPSALQALYGGVGAALVLIPLLPAVRGHLAARRAQWGDA